MVAPRWARRSPPLVLGGHGETGRSSPPVTLVGRGAGASASACDGRWCHRPGRSRMRAGRTSRPSDPPPDDPAASAGSSRPGRVERGVPHAPPQCGLDGSRPAPAAPARLSQRQLAQPGSSQLISSTTAGPSQLVSLTTARPARSFAARLINHGSPSPALRSSSRSLGTARPARPFAARSMHRRSPSSAIRSSSHSPQLAQPGPSQLVRSSSHYLTLPLLDCQLKTS